VPIILELFADDPDASGGKVKPTDEENMRAWMALVDGSVWPEQ
jgi:hypothetical protein